ncbi:MAG: radical SAM protein, partial [Magnetococcales bacterium]|nr:radical SAM protein [Magnetococcales bacterium]
MKIIQTNNYLPPDALFQGAVSTEAIGLVSPPRHLLLQWHITDRCDHRCKHCYQHDFTLPGPDWQRMRSILAQYLTMLRWIRRHHGGREQVGHIHVTGGEPLVHGDFWSLVELLPNYKDLFSFAVLTNGRSVEQQQAERLKKLGASFVQVSLEGRRESHDDIRGEGDYDQVVQSIRTIVRAGLSCSVSFTAHRRNWKDFPHVARVARKAGATRIWADRLIPFGTGESMADDVLSPDETQQFIKVMVRAGLETKLLSFGKSHVAMNRALQFLESGGRPYRCPAGDSLVALMPDGELLPCRRMPVAVGNLNRQKLVDIYKNAPLLHALRNPEQSGEGCEECFYKGSCSGGLRCLSMGVYGSPFKKDPGCWRHP